MDGLDALLDSASELTNERPRLRTRYVHRESKQKSFYRRETSSDRKKGGCGD